jgi:hypothetical protein
MYQQLKDLDLLRIISLINLHDINGVPEFFLLKHMNLDVCTVQSLDNRLYEALNVFPEYKNKIIFNITEYLNKDMTKIMNINLFQNFIIRDMLSRSYFLYKDIWLNRNLLFDLTKFYAVPISSTLGRIYNLNMQEQSIIGCILSYFFLSKCIDDKNAVLSFLPSLYFLGSNTIINENLKHILELEEKYPFNKGSNLIELVGMIKELSPVRLDVLDMVKFNTSLRTFNSNPIISLISGEYPPYWCYNVFACLSGNTSNLTFMFKRLNLMTEAIKFTNDFLKYDKFFNNLEVI